MKKHLLRNLVPLLVGLVPIGCETLGALARGDTHGAIRSGIDDAGNLIKKYAETTDEVNVSQEYYVGRSVAANVFKRYKRFDDPRLTRYVRLVGGNVAKAAKGTGDDDLKEPYRGYFFVILDDNQVNAFAAPGGFVFITVGALRAMQTEDELACVLGHEIGHITDRHGTKLVLKQKRFSIPLQMATEGIQARTPAFIGELAGQLGGMATDLMNQATGGLGTEYELRADELGTIFAARAGYNPRAMVDFVKRTRHGEDLKK